jgi:hypothetical protein
MYPPISRVPEFERGQPRSTRGTPRPIHPHAHGPHTRRSNVVLLALSRRSSTVGHPHVAVPRRPPPIPQPIEGPRSVGMGQLHRKSGAKLVQDPHGGSGCARGPVGRGLPSRLATADRGDPNAFAKSQHANVLGLDVTLPSGAKIGKWLDLHRFASVPPHRRGCRRSRCPTVPDREGYPAWKGPSENVGSSLVFGSSVRFGVRVHFRNPN